MLMAVVAARKERLTRQNLSEDAAERPDVDSIGVLCESHYYLRSAVPETGDILTRGALLCLDSGCRAGEAEIADLQTAVLVEQEIRWGKVAVQDTSRVHSIESAQDLPDEVLADISAV